MKKTIFILLTLTLCLSVFLGCTETECEHNWERIENYDRYTAVDKCRSCGETRMYTDPDAEKSDESNSVGNDSTQSDNINQIPNVAINTFSEYLDSENIVPSLSQGKFIDQMEKYRYEGKKITDIAVGYYYDGYDVSGYSATGELFSFCNDYTASEENKIVEYSNSFYTEVALDGLTLPYGIDFDDTLAEVFQKIGIDKDPDNDFVADPDTETKMTLYRDERSSLVFNNLKLTKDAVDFDFPYELVYTEVYGVTDDDGQEMTVTRKITMSFDYNDKLATFGMSVCESYYIKYETKVYIDYVDESGFIWGHNYVKYPDADKDFCPHDYVSVRYYGGVSEESGDLNGHIYEWVIENVTSVELIWEAASEDGSAHYEKPVIYLYPEAKTEASVKVDFDGELTVTIPEYNGGWNVTAYPDGRIIDSDGQMYPYLFWEGVPNGRIEMTEGFCVSGSETEKFLEGSLATLGLSKSEAADFIEYWLPRMEKNEYNLISFVGEEYTEMAPLEISPAPDTVIRVFMCFKAADEYTDIAPQTLPEAPERVGFTVVEWGGTEIK